MRVCKLGDFCPVLVLLILCLRNRNHCIYILEVSKLYFVKHFIQLTNHNLPKH